MARILVIDDQDFVRDVIRHILEAAGHQVLEARNGEEGVRLFRREPFDLLLCDIFMPEKDGLEVIREVRQESSSVKILAVSGGSFQGKLDVLPITAELGANGTLRKPFTAEELCAAVDQALRGPSSALKQ